MTTRPDWYMVVLVALVATFGIVAQERFRAHRSPPAIEGAGVPPQVLPESTVRLDAATMLAEASRLLEQARRLGAECRQRPDPRADLERTYYRNLARGRLVPVTEHAPGMVVP